MERGIVHRKTSRGSFGMVFVGSWSLLRGGRQTGSTVSVFLRCDYLIVDLIIISTVDFEYFLHSFCVKKSDNACTFCGLSRYLRN